MARNVFKRLNKTCGNARLGVDKNLVLWYTIIEEREGIPNESTRIKKKN